MGPHVTEIDTSRPTISPEIEQVLDNLLRGAVARGELSQSAAHAVFVAAWHLAAMADTDADASGVGHAWPTALRQGVVNRGRRQGDTSAAREAADLGHLSEVLLSF